MGEIHDLVTRLGAIRLLPHVAVASANRLDVFLKNFD